jgi:hypothetical protein
MGMVGHYTNAREFDLLGIDCIIRQVATPYCKGSGDGLFKVES